MNMQNLMAQAQKMQRDIAKKKEEIDKMEFEGSSELVNIKVNGKKEVISIKINSNDNLDKDDIEALEDMIKIAFNNALKKVDAETEKQMGSYGGALGGLF